MNISLRQMKVFCAIAQERNFSRAGEKVELSQPAVSRAIFELEEQLNLKLFDRTTREVRLTDAGGMLAQRLPRLMDELQVTLQELQSWSGSRRGRVRVASSPTLSSSLMPVCLTRCAAYEPDIEVLMLDRIQQDVLKSVTAGEVDLGIIVGTTPHQLPGIYCERIMEDPFVAVLPKTHTLALKQERSKPLLWKCLDQQELVLLDYASGSRALIDEVLKKYQICHVVTQQVGHSHTGFEMVRAGLGLSVMPGLSIPETGVPGLVIRRLFPEVQRRIMLVHRKNKTPTPFAQCFWRIVKDCAQDIMKHRENFWR